MDTYSCVRLTFKLNQGGESAEVVYEGTVEQDGKAIKGKVNYGGFASGTFTGTRK